MMIASHRSSPHRASVLSARTCHFRMARHSLIRSPQMKTPVDTDDTACLHRSRKPGWAFRPSGVRIPPSPFQSPRRIPGFRFRSPAGCFAVVGAATRVSEPRAARRLRALRPGLGALARGGAALRCLALARASRFFGRVASTRAAGSICRPPGLGSRQMLAAKSALLGLVTRTFSGARRNARYWVLQPRPFRPDPGRKWCRCRGWRSRRRR